MEKDGECRILYRYILLELPLLTPCGNLEDLEVCNFYQKGPEGVHLGVWPLPRIRTPQSQVLKPVEARLRIGADEGSMG